MLPAIGSTVVRHLRAAAQIAPGGPAAWLGLRTALATALPLAVSPWLVAESALWAPLAGFGIALLDKGGAYRTRARTMTMGAVGGLVAVVIGGLVSQTGSLGLVVIALGVAVCGLSHAFGVAAVGTSIAVQLIVSASLPIAAVDLPMRAGGFAGGAAWAVVLSLLLWPVRVYAPARRGVSALLNAVADHASAIAAADRSTTAWRDGLTRRHRLLRERLELARETLAATRRGRADESGRGERLLAVVQTGEQMLGTLVGLEEVIDAGCPEPALRRIAEGLAIHATATRDLASRVLLEHPPPSAPAPAWDPEAARAGLEPVGPVDRALTEQALLLLGRVREDGRVAADLVESLVDDREPPPVAPAPMPIREPLSDRLAELADLGAPVPRHALRIAAGVLITSTVAGGLDLRHGWWATLTCFVLLQPQRAATTVRTVQRVVGTVIGGILAAALAWMIVDPLALVLSAVVLGGLSAAVMQMNHALYATLVTPTFVLLAEMRIHEDALVEARIAATLLGGLVALAAGLVLWPGREHERFGARMAEALEAAAAYLAAVADRATRGRTTWSGEPTALVTSRRQLGLALNEAEVALDAVVAEGAPAALLEPRMALMTFARRLAATINAFGSGRAVTSYERDEAVIGAFASVVGARLEELAAAVRRGATPAARERSSLDVTDPVVAARLARIDLQLAVLTDAAVRAAQPAVASRS